MKNEIVKYINNMNKSDIVNYCKKNNISISNNELDILYDFIKNKYDIFFNNPNNFFNDLKSLISLNLYNNILELYDKYKIFI